MLHVSIKACILPLLYACSVVTLCAHGGLLCPLPTLKINLNAVDCKKPEATAVGAVWLQLL